MPRQLPTVVLQNVELSDLQGLRITTNPVQVRVQYSIRATEDGVPMEDPLMSGIISSSLPTPLKQDIVAWLNAQIIPEINTQEGMS